MLKPYERNEELSKDFIQGWYMPDDVISDFLLESEQLHADGYSDVIGDPRNYHILDMKVFSDKSRDNFLYNLNGVILNYQEKYSYLCTLNFKLFKDINVQYWEPGNYYSKFHYELRSDAESVLRNLVFMTYLNNIEDGGETEFHYQKIKIKPKKGLTIVWPANWTHTHRGCETSEHKHAVTGWFEIIPSKPDIYYDVPNKENCKREYE